MIKLKEYKYIFCITITVLMFIFYWFQIRPVQIRKECMNDIKYGNYTEGSIFDKYQAEKGVLSSERIDELYLNCVREKGLSN